MFKGKDASWAGPGKIISRGQPYRPGGSLKICDAITLRLASKNGSEASLTKHEAGLIFVVKI